MNLIFEIFLVHNGPKKNNFPHYRLDTFPFVLLFVSCFYDNPIEVKTENFYFYEIYKYFRLAKSFYITVLNFQKVNLAQCLDTINSKNKITLIVRVLKILTITNEVSKS